jgi:hypothetical protein
MLLLLENIILQGSSLTENPVRKNESRVIYASLSREKRTIAPSASVVRRKAERQKK